MRQHIRTAGMALGAALLAGGAALAEDPIKVGVSVTQSPPGSVVQGTQVTHGLEIALELINEAGGIMGRPVELVWEDDQGMPERGRSGVERMITRDGVVAITGTHASGVALGQIEVVEQHGIPFINTNAWSDDIRHAGFRTVFNPSNYNSRVAGAMAEVIAAMGVETVIAFAENTDYGIGQAELLAEMIAEVAPGADYRYEVLSREARDFMPAILPLRADPPDMIINILLPPAAYILINQLYEQGVAPSGATWLYDGAGIADYPDFWDNVSDAGVGLLSFGLYHPDMELPPLGEQVREIYEERHGTGANRLIFQAADSLYLIKEAIEVAGSTEPDAMIEALRGIEWTGTRGTITFSGAPGFTFQQWVEIPYVTYQLTEVNQDLADAPLVQAPGMELDTSKLMAGQ
jgi:branched-chain amino acid transport system substrate-binding protein